MFIKTIINCGQVLSASNYRNGTGILNVTVIDLGITDFMFLLVVECWMLTLKT